MYLLLYILEYRQKCCKGINHI